MRVARVRVFYATTPCHQGEKRGNSHWAMRMVFPPASRISEGNGSSYDKVLENPFILVVACVSAAPSQETTTYVK